MKLRLITGVLILLFIPFVLKGQSETYSVEAAKFNSKNSDEFSPVYYKGGLIFCSNRNQSLFRNYVTPDNKGLLKINFVDTITWKVRLFSKNLSTRFNDGPASFSKNGDTIYFSRNLKVDGTIDQEYSPRNKLGIFTATYEDDDWVKILDVRFNNEYFNITTPYISPDGKRLFFSSDDPSGFGGTDLFYCNWVGDYWDDPINMGPEINTTGNESYPFVNSEGGVFFSSDGHPGLGGKDIFYTKESDGKWLEPVHLDAPINSKNDDFGLIADSVMSSGYFSSNRDRSVDIYRFRTNIRQLFYCEKQRTNQYCFKFTDKDAIAIDTRYLNLIWNFGDGGAASGLNAEHCFKGPGKYKIRLDAVDKKTGQIFFTKLSYDLELRDVEQPVINCPESGLAGETIKFDGLSSHFPGSEILDYTWYFGDGARSEGGTLNHTFNEKGDYNVKLGLIVRDQKTGKIFETCSIRQVSIFNNSSEKSSFDKRQKEPIPAVNVKEYDHAGIQNIYSAEDNYAQDNVYRVEVIRSKMKIQPDDKLLKNLPSKFKVKEDYLPAEKAYSYTIAEELTLMATYPAFNEITSMGFGDTRVISVIPQEQAVRELNNLKRVFGVSADQIFGRNNYNLTSEGTQLLDLVLGFMSKYPALKLEIACHTDNQGTEWTKQNITQRRAEAMVDYLAGNGISRLRLTPKGYADSRPVAPNYQESDRKLNRRVDFRIVETNK